MDFPFSLLLAPYLALAAPLRWLAPEWAAVYFALIRNGWILSLIFIVPPVATLLWKKYRWKRLRSPKFAITLVTLYSALVLLAFSPLVGGHDALMFFSPAFNFTRYDVEGKGTYYVRNNCDWLDGFWKGTLLYKRHGWLPTMTQLRGSACYLVPPGKPNRRDVHVTDEHGNCDHESEPCEEVFQD